MKRPPGSSPGRSARVKGRLARARSLLESRLTRRGVASSAGALGLALVLRGTRAEAAVPTPLLEATCRAAAQLSAGELPGLVLSTSVAGLLKGVLSTMMLQKLKTDSPDAHRLRRRARPAPGSWPDSTRASPRGRGRRKSRRSRSGPICPET